MLKLSAHQMQVLHRHAALRNVERVEAFARSCGLVRFAACTPNALREQAIAALRRASQFGAHTVQDAGKVLVLTALFGRHFDLRPRAQGGLFADPARIDAAELDTVFRQVMNAPGLEGALRRAAEPSEART